MKKSAVLILCMLFATPSFADETIVTERTYDIRKCSSPAGTISIGSVLCKAAACKKDLTPQNAFIQGLLSLSGQPSVEGIGDGMADMLLTALEQTGCVDIFERDGMERLRQEMASTGPSINITPPEYLVMGSVTSIRIERSNTNLGGGILPVLSAVDVKKTKVFINLDMRLIHASTGKIIFTGTYEGSNEKTGIGLGTGASFGGLGFGGMYSSLKGTPIEEVARDVIIRAAVDIVGNIHQHKAMSATPVTIRQTPSLQTEISEPVPYRDPAQNETN